MSLYSTSADSSNCKYIEELEDDLENALQQLKITQHSIKTLEHKNLESQKSINNLSKRVTDLSVEMEKLNL